MRLFGQMCGVLALLSVGAAAWAGQMPNGYGINVHFGARNRPVESSSVEQICKTLAGDGFGTVRVGFSWGAVQRSPDSPFDFASSDRIFAAARANRLKIMPLLKGAPKWAEPVWKNTAGWSAFVRAFVGRYGSFVDSVEIWNEENLSTFWKHPREVRPWTDPYVEDYVDLLKASYEAVKSVNPKIRVTLGGLSQIPMRYVGNIYKLGANRYFDVMNVHPYSYPRAPEGSFDTRLEELRAFMDAHGDADKPIRVSEIGWPTHQLELARPDIVKDGLHKINPGKTDWRLAYVAFDEQLDEAGSVIESLRRALPGMGDVRVVDVGALEDSLRTKKFDVVMLSPGANVRAEALGPVRQFVKEGGVLAWFGKRTTSSFKRTKEGILVEDSEYDREGFRKYFRFSQTDMRRYFKAAVFEPSGLKEGDVFAPLRQEKTKKGEAFVSAAVIRYASDMKGAIILSGYDEARGGISEELQATYLVRMLAMASALGIDNVECYEYFAPENDRFNPQDHFGLCHRDFSPKPGYRAYLEYMRRRPPGSVNDASTRWKSSEGNWFFPQWRRPDGVRAGLLWKRGRAEERTMSFGSDDIRFFGLFGAPLSISKGSEKGTYRITLGETPVYWEARNPPL